MKALIALILGTVVLFGCSTNSQLNEISERLDELESEVIALRAENRAIASALGLYGEEEFCEDCDDEFTE